MPSFQIKSKISDPAAQSDSYTWKPLRLLNSYRLTLSILILASMVFSNKPGYFGSHDPQLALFVGILYMLFSAAGEIFIRRQKPRFVIQLYTQISGDILAITLLMHASGGIGSGLGMLLVVAVAGGSVIMASRMANLYAAIATIAILSEEFYSDATHAFPANYTQAGVLGVTFFTTAILAFVLAKRLRESELLATQRGIDLANLAELNEHVIQRMQAGILVVDEQDQIRLMNRSAWMILGMPSLTDNKTLTKVSPQLAEQVRLWQHKTRRNDDSSESLVFRPLATSTDIFLRFTRLGADQRSGTLIFLEDTSVMAQQAQQMKLASLGRLTASIAHEIRNPLGAISPAGQLLAESPRLDKSDVRLTEIIQAHSTRVNTMIENVLQLSRRERSKPQLFELKSWLQKLLDEFIREQHVEPKDIDLDITPPDVQIFMDPSQLHQVIWNLLQNGVRHSKEYKGNPKLELRGGVTRESGSPFLDVIDHGDGIDPVTVQQIFEPFFTTETHGTGLGLYIARELCEINQARLGYIPVPSGGSCFRINFSDPNRHQL